MGNDGSLILGSILFVLLFALYMLPTIVAIGREHHNKVPIILVNIFLGFTFLGWIAALIWAFTSPPPVREVLVYREPS